MRNRLLIKTQFLVVYFVKKKRKKEKRREREKTKEMKKNKEKQKCKLSKDYRITELNLRKNV